MTDAITRSEPIYRELFEQLTDGVVVAEAETRRIRFCNRVLARMLGYEEEELLALSVGDVHPPGTAPTLEGLVRRAFEGEEVPPSDLPMLRKDGSLVQVELTPRAMTSGGRSWLLAVVRDVSERRRLEEELSRQEQALRDAAEMAHVGGWDFDPVTLESIWTAETLRIHDLPPGAAPTAEQGIAFFQGEHRLRIDAAVKEAIEKGTPYDLELELRTATGARKWVRTICHPVVREGRVLRVRGSIQDITERRESEEALRESREQLRSILGSMDDLVFGLDAGGRITGYYSPETEELYVPPEQFLGRTFAEVLPPDVAEALQRTIEAAAATGKAQHLEYALDIGGARMWWSGTVSPRRGPGGELSGFTLVSRNISDRKRVEEALRGREEQLRLFVRHAPAALAMLDREMRYLTVSRRWLADYGLGERDLRGLSLLEVLPGIGEGWREAHRRALAGEVVRSEEDRLERKDGTVQWLRWEVRPWRDTAGEAGGTVVFTEDISDRKAAEEALLRSQKLEALGTLAGGIAHDFNNILLAISGNAHLAAADVPPDHPVQASLGEISRAAARAADLVRRILAFSRPDEARREALDLSPAVEEAVRLVRAILPALIEIRTELEPDLPAVVADPTQIHQIVVNLATNAAHAIGPHPGTIGIRVRACAPPPAPGPQPAPAGGWVELSVTDDGCGMDAATVERIFDPFFSTRPPGQGTGLGLSVVHGILKTLGGSVVVESQPGKGTTISARFPAAAGAAVEPAAPPVAIPQPRAARLLYVDDEEALCVLVRRALGRLGYEVTALSDPAAALRLFREGPAAFDALITDVSMPGMSGFDLARELLALRPGLPVVVTTGYLRPEDEEAARSLGIVELILKPDTVSELGLALDRLLRSRAG